MSIRLLRLKQILHKVILGLNQPDMPHSPMSTLPQHIDVPFNSAQPSTVQCSNTVPLITVQSITTLLVTLAAAGYATGDAALPSATAGQHQLDIAELLMRKQRSTTPSFHSIPVFKGDPFGKYKLFSSFEHFFRVKLTSGISSIYGKI